MSAGLAGRISMFLGISLLGYVLLAIGALIFFLMGGRYFSDRLTPLSYRRNLPYGSYVCVGTIQISGRLFNGHTANTSYLTVLKCPNGKLRVYRFEERCLGSMLVHRDGVDEADLYRP